LISAIMGSEPPPITVLKPLSPPALEHVAKRCLAKDPDERWQSARDVASEMQWISSSSTESGLLPEVTPARSRVARLGWVVAGVIALAALAAAGAALWSRGRGTTGDRSLHAAILHDGEGVIDPTPANVAISPDSRRIAYIVIEPIGQRLWVRDLESQTSRRLSDLVPVEFPFWSPDGRWVAFFTAARLWKVPAEGGAPISLCAVPAGAGGTWGAKDIIVYAPTAAGPLFSVRAAGGSPLPATALDASRRQIGHRMPWFLPDGDHFLFAALPRVGPDVEIFAGSLGSKQVKRIMAAVSGATYADPGYLLFERDRKLVAQRFDASRLELTGEPVPIGDPPLAMSGWEATWLATASRDGRLASLRSWPRRTEVEWVDRSGRRLGQVPFPPGRWEELSLAPNGHSVLASRPVAVLGNEIWLLDSERGMAERVSPPESMSEVARWAPDGRSFVYNSNAASGRREIYRQMVDRAAAPQIIPTIEAQIKVPLASTPDGAFLLFSLYDPAAGVGLWIAPLRGGGAPTRLLPVISGDSGAAVSPDGHWLAYVSEESGRPEIYVTSFPTVGHRTRVSASGGLIPMWTRGGKELLFVARPGSDGSVMSVAVESGTAFAAGTPHSLFTRRGLVSVAVTQDGERLLLSVESGETPPPHIGLTLNWTAALKRP